MFFTDWLINFNCDISYKDFLTVKYWRFAHSMTNNIFKINSLNSEEMITMNANKWGIKSKWKTVFHITYLNLENISMGLGLFYDYKL